jgi:hypothetical protein
MNLKKIGKLFTSKSVGTGPSSYKKNYRSTVSRRLRYNVLEGFDKRYDFSDQQASSITVLPTVKVDRTHNIDCENKCI